jgi:predicted transcriptional regulator
MLTEIMKAFEKDEGPVALNELALEMGVERSALEGMLQTLVRQGKLREVLPGSETCADCPRNSGCAYLQAAESGGKVYEIVKKSG